MRKNSKPPKIKTPQIGGVNLICLQALRSGFTAHHASKGITDIFETYSLLMFEIIISRTIDFVNIVCYNSVIKNLIGNKKNGT